MRPGVVYSCEKGRPRGRLRKFHLQFWCGFFLWHKLRNLWFHQVLCYPKKILGFRTPIVAGFAISRSWEASMAGRWFNRCPRQVLNHKESQPLLDWWQEWIRPNMRTLRQLSGFIWLPCLFTQTLTKIQCLRYMSEIIGGFSVVRVCVCVCLCVCVCVCLNQKRWNVLRFGLVWFHDFCSSVFLSISNFSCPAAFIFLTMSWHWKGTDVLPRYLAVTEQRRVLSKPLGTGELQSGIHVDK